MRAHTQSCKGDDGGPGCADGHKELFLVVQAAADRRDEDHQHGAGGAGRMAGREGAELIGRDAVGDELFLERRAGLPPVGEVGVVAGRVDQAHPRAAPGNLDDVDEQHDADADEDDCAQKTQERLGLAATRHKEKGEGRERVDKERHQQCDRRGERGDVVRRLMDGEEDAARDQADAEGQQDHVQLRAELAAPHDQQHAAAGQQREGWQLAEGGKKLAEGALVAGIEEAGDRQVGERPGDQQRKQHQRRQTGAARIGSFQFFHGIPRNLENRPVSIAQKVGAGKLTRGKKADIIGKRNEARI